MSTDQQTAGAKIVGQVARLAALPPEAFAAAQARHEATAAARETARRQTAWDAFIRARGRRYADCTLENFTIPDDKQVEARKKALTKVSFYADEMQMRVSAGQNLIFHGPAGTGKDHLMAATVRTAIFRYGIGPIFWIDAAALLLKARHRDASLSADLQAAEQAAVFALSDLLPVKAMDGAEATLLQHLIDRRYSRQRPIWLTVNINQAESIDGKFDTAVLGRLRENLWAVSCNWPDRRHSQRVAK